MADIKVKKPEFPTLFGGFGFHNSEALLYRLCGKEQFDQKICKCYRELSPGFMRTFAGYADWTKESMDTFADYYERMQKWTDTPIYFAAAKGQLHFNDEERKKYAENVVLEENVLRWDAVDDPMHCYYRVYRGATPDFVPSKENQIASTVAETLEFDAPYLDDAAIKNVKGDHFKVISVCKKR